MFNAQKTVKNVLRPFVKPSFDCISRLRRTYVLRKQLKEVHFEDLIQDLEALDLPDGAVVLVHSSLKNLGFVTGGAKTVVSALEKVIVTRRSGTLILPTFSIAGTMRKSLTSGSIFDVRSTPTNLGAIPEVFRNHPGVRRSVHPTHSFAALGDKAEWIVSGHLTAGSNFGAGTPMVRAMEAGGWILGLGTNLGNVTFYHCLEDLRPDFPVNVYSSDSPFETLCVDFKGGTHQLYLSGHDENVSKTRIDRPENKFIRNFYTEYFEKTASLRWFKIGEGWGWSLPLTEMYRACETLLESGVTIYSSINEVSQSKLNFIAEDNEYD